MANQHRERGGGRTDRPRPNRQNQPNRANEPPIDLNAITPEELNRRGEEWGKKLADQHTGVKTNQLRNIYSTVQHIRVRSNQPQPDTADINRRLIFLKPKLAYASGRQPVLKGLRDVLVGAIDSVVKSKNPEKARENFFILMESIVAYHKFYGGRDS